MLGCNYSPLILQDKINNYNDFIDDLVTYFEFEEVRALPGFVPLVNLNFSFAHFFENNFGYASYSRSESYKKYNFIISKTGETWLTNDSLIEKDLIYDKYEFTENGKVGIKDIFGNIIVNAEYESFIINEDTILMIRGNDCDLYIYGSKSNSFNFLQECSLPSSETILIDGRLYGLNLRPLTAGGYDVVSAKAEERMIIYSAKEKLYGYADSSFNVIIPPIFELANAFTGAFARVKIDGKHALIDKMGEIVFSAEGVIPGNFYDGYFTFSKNNLYGIMDKNFNEVIEPSFSAIQDGRVFGDFIIDNYFLSRFYSVSKQKYTDEIYETIQPSDGKFIVKNTDKYSSLLDKDLNVIVSDCDKISYAGGFLMTAKNGSYNFYKEIGF